MKRKKARRRQMGAWILVGLFELITTAAPTAVTAAIVLPLAYAERGYRGMGSEWLIIAAVFCITYGIIHNKVCDKIFKEG